MESKVVWEEVFGGDGKCFPPLSLPSSDDGDKVGDSECESKPELGNERLLGPQRSGAPESPRNPLFPFPDMSVYFHIDKY